MKLFYSFIKFPCPCSIFSNSSGTVGNQTDINITFFSKNNPNNHRCICSLHYELSHCRMIFEYHFSVICSLWEPEHIFVMPSPAFQAKRTSGQKTGNHCLHCLYTTSHLCFHGHCCKTVKPQKRCLVAPAMQNHRTSASENQKYAKCYTLTSL